MLMVQAQSNSSPDLHTPDSTDTADTHVADAGAPLVPTRPARPIEGGLIWIDLEMTGLKPDSDRIIEIALVVTDAHLEILIESEPLAIRQPKATMDAMDAWNRSTHGKSGLTERVLASTIDEVQAEQTMLAFLAPWIARGASPMCGNTICQDRRFLARWMPTLESFSTTAISMSVRSRNWRAVGGLTLPKDFKNATPIRRLRISMSRLTNCGTTARPSCAWKPTLRPTSIRRTPCPPWRERPCARAPLTD